MNNSSKESVAGYKARNSKIILTLLKHGWQSFLGNNRHTLFHFQFKSEARLLTPPLILLFLSENTTGWFLTVADSGHQKSKLKIKNRYLKSIFKVKIKNSKSIYRLRSRFKNLLFQLEKSKSKIKSRFTM